MNVKKGGDVFQFGIPSRARHKNSFVFAFARFSAPIQELNALRGRLVRDRVPHSPKPTLHGYVYNREKNRAVFRFPLVLLSFLIFLAHCVVKCFSYLISSS
ncbi:hypothetical protein CDAR_607801 [Caerostris darwini]|uniref:Uncharacterized protein n=1 Tax=Caerostris darwini TaxID=1538125 RepID=A0AAV4ULW8_9ARAC|nr:hypothetical protein CDAR_607801 [Caerostris darwini]